MFCNLFPWGKCKQSWDGEVMFSDLSQQFMAHEGLPLSQEKYHNANTKNISEMSQMLYTHSDVDNTTKEEENWLTYAAIMEKDIHKMDSQT